MKLALFALAAAAVALPAFAQAPTSPNPAMRAAREQMRSACATDMQTLCASATDGPSRMQCMRENQDKLSEGCKSAVAALMAARQGASGGSH